MNQFTYVYFDDIALNSSAFAVAQEQALTGGLYSPDSSFLRVQEHAYLVTVSQSLGTNQQAPKSFLRLRMDQLSEKNLKQIFKVISNQYLFTNNNEMSARIKSIS